jgi:hypothetical protein
MGQLVPESAINLIGSVLSEARVQHDEAMRRVRSARTRTKTRIPFDPDFLSNG